MFISYTSKRRHRADILGPELAPSMVYTNWTAGNSATLSNDASGNLKIAYNASPSPYATKLFTVTVGSIYRVACSAIDDGVSQLPAIIISATSPTTRDLGDNDLRADESGSFEYYIRAPSTELYITMVCEISSAGYSLFHGVSLTLVDTLGHGKKIVLQDDVLTGAYTATNSTLDYVDIFSKSLDRKDNSIRLTNVGAVLGEARRTNPVPAIAGRKSKFSVTWIPHNSPYCWVAASSNGLSNVSDYGAVQRLVDIDNAASFFKAASGLRWNFTNTNDGWVSTNITPTNNATYISLLSTTADPQFSKTGLSFSGLSNRYVIMWCRRTSAAWSQELTLYYSTAAHGFSASHNGVYNGAVLAQVAAGTGLKTMVVWDMWQLAAGGSDWKDNTITGLRIDVANVNAASFEIDLISVGNINPIELEFSSSGQNYAYVRLQNGTDTGGEISYYILPHVDQIDSTYTLSQTGVNTLDPMDEYIVNETRTIAGVSYGLYDRTDEAWSVVSDKIEDAAKADWDEFFASCCALETFRFDPSATTDTTTTKTCELVPGSQKLTRIEKTSMWRAQFKVRVAA